MSTNKAEAYMPVATAATIADSVDNYRARAGKGHTTMQGDALLVVHEALTAATRERDEEKARAQWSDNQTDRVYRELLVERKALEQAEQRAAREAKLHAATQGRCNHAEQRSAAAVVAMESIHSMAVVTIRDDTESLVQIIELINHKASAFLAPQQREERDA